VKNDIILIEIVVNNVNNDLNVLDEKRHNVHVEHIHLLEQIVVVLVDQDNIARIEQALVKQLKLDIMLIEFELVNKQNVQIGNLQIHIIIPMVQIITVHGNVIDDMNNKEIHVSRKLQNVVIVQ